MPLEKAAVIMGRSVVTNPCSIHLRVCLLTFADFCNILQGLTPRFQARGPKRSFDKFIGQKKYFCIIIYRYYFGPLVSKSRGPQQNLGAYAPGKFKPCILFRMLKDKSRALISMFVVRLRLVPLCLTCTHRK